MNGKIIDFLRAAFPFLLTLFLWRLVLPWINPAGLLALIPIFFCTFIRPTPWFAPFGAIMCFLVDYQCDTVLFWTSVFCLCYAANGFQAVIDVTRADMRGIGPWMIFFGGGVLIMSVAHFTNFMNIFRTVWTIALGAAMYLPITALIKRVNHD